MVHSKVTASPRRVTMSFGVLNLLRHCTSNQTDTLSFCLLRWLQNEVDTMCSAPYPDVWLFFFRNSGLRRFYRDCLIADYA